MLAKRNVHPTSPLPHIYTDIRLLRQCSMHLKWAMVYKTCKKKLIKSAKSLSVVFPHAWDGKQRANKTSHDIYIPPAI